MKKKRTMNTKKRTQCYTWLVERDGEYCQNCKRDKASTYLIVHHIDNDPSNNDPANLQILCRSCNTKKNPRGRGKVKRKTVPVEEPPTTKTILLNRQYKPRFCEYVATQFRDNRRVEMEELINSGAQVTGASTITTRRYLSPLCSSEGPYRVVIIDGVKFIELKTR